MAFLHWSCFVNFHMLGASDEISRLLLQHVCQIGRKSMTLTHTVCMKLLLMSAVVSFRCQADTCVTTLGSSSLGFLNVCINQHSVKSGRNGRMVSEVFAVLLPVVLAEAFRPSLVTANRATAVIYVCGTETFIRSQARMALPTSTTCCASPAASWASHQLMPLRFGGGILAGHCLYDTTQPAPCLTLVHFDLSHVSLLASCVKALPASSIVLLHTCQSLEELMDLSASSSALPCMPIVVHSCL